MVEILLYAWFFTAMTLYLYIYYMTWKEVNK